MSRGSLPHERRGGRQLGTPNKLTGDLRQMVHEALIEAGGRDYLREQARANPVAFLGLVGRCLPKHVTGAMDVNVREGVRVELVEAAVALMMGHALPDAPRKADVIPLIRPEST